MTDSSEETLTVREALDVVVMTGAQIITRWPGDDVCAVREEAQDVLANALKVQSAPPPRSAQPAWEIQAGSELARLVELVRFSPGQSTGFLHSAFDAERFLWGWFLKWQEAASGVSGPAPEQATKTKT